MVSISTIKNLGKTILNGLKQPSAATVFLGGGLAGTIILGVCKTIADSKKIATFKKDNATLQAEKEALQAQCDSLQNELNKLDEKTVKHPFEYTPRMEYAVSDTTFNGDNNPESIRYFKDKDKLWNDNHEVVFFNEDGSIGSSYSDNYDKTWEIDKLHYDKHTIEHRDKNGDLTYKDCFSKKGDYLYMSFDSDQNLRQVSKGNEKTDVETNTYYPPETDGNGKVLYRKTGDAEITYTNKKTGRVIKVKQLKNGVLDYTVVPKYDKDGVVIKNDTTWNNNKSA